MTRGEEARAELKRRGLSLTEEEPQPQVEQEQNQLSQQPAITQPQISEPTNISNIGLRALADIAKGGAEAGRNLRNLPYNLTHYFNPQAAERIANSGFLGRALFAPDVNPIHNLGVNNPNTLDKMLQSIAPAAAIGIAGGSSLPGMMGGGALAGALENEKDPVLGALGGATTGALLKGGGSLVNMARGMQPAKYGKELVKRGTEEYLKDVAKPSSELYEAVKTGTSGKPIIENRELVKMVYSPKNIRKESDLKSLYESFFEKRGFEEAKQLKSQLGTEANELLTKKKIHGNLDASERERLSELIGERKTIGDLMNSFLEKNPTEKEMFQKANLLHRKEVIPSRNAAKIINDYVDTENEIINKRKLISSLKEASSKNKMAKKTLTKETIALNKLYEKNLNNKETIGKYAKWLNLGSVPAMGFGYGGYHTLRHLMEANRQ